MTLQIGDKEFEVPRIKAGKLRKLLALQDKAVTADSVVETLDLTLEFYIELLGEKYPEVNVEWLEENLDAHQCLAPYFNKLLLDIMGEPKKEEPEVVA